MVYYGKEKENHRGSHVRYYHCGEWHEGTLLEPVKYQVVVTMENPLAILSTHTYVKPSEDEVNVAKENVMNGNYTGRDLRVLSRYRSPDKSVYRISEVEAVEITEASPQEEDRLYIQ